MSAIAGVDVSLTRTDNLWTLEFSTSAAVPLMPQLAKPTRADGLWIATCFEMFVRGAGDAYVEFNFSPSSQWAAYSFSRYREGAKDLVIADPHVERLQNGVKAQLDYAPPLGPVHIALSAIIVETDGTKSYWALRHPLGPPDFHHPDCFAVALPAPERP